MTGSSPWRYLLTDGENEVLFRAAEVVGFFGVRSGDSWGTFDLVGELVGPLDRVEQSEEAELVVVDQGGNWLGAYFVGAPAITVVTTGDGNDARLRVKGFRPAWPGEAVEAVWSRWWSGRPQEAGAWVSYTDSEKTAWLEVARLHSRFHVSVEKSGPFVLDGRVVVDVPSFYCALGEAINGPGGYYGSTLDGLADCMAGGFGPVAPFVLAWLRSEVARSHLGANSERDYFAEIVHLLAEHGVEVRLE